jgi:hypothetical protein
VARRLGELDIMTTESGEPGSVKIEVGEQDTCLPLTCADPGESFETLCGGASAPGRHSELDPSIIGFELDLTDRETESLQTTDASIEGMCVARHDLGRLGQLSPELTITLVDPFGECDEPLVVG